MEQTIFNYAEYFATHNYILAYTFFFLNACLQALFPPYPGDTIIVFQGYLGNLGVFNNVIIVLSTLLGTVLSGIFLFLIFRKYGDKITNLKFIKRFFDVDKIESLKKFFNKYGAALIIFNRFVPGLGMITVIAAGILKVSRVKGIISLTIAGVIHNMLLLSLGYTVGYNMELIKIILIRFNKLFIVLAVILATIFALMYVRKLNKKPIKAIARD